MSDNGNSGERSKRAEVMRQSQAIMALIEAAGRDLDCNGPTPGIQLKHRLEARWEIARETLPEEVRCALQGDFLPGSADQIPGNFSEAAVSDLTKILDQVALEFSKQGGSTYGLAVARCVLVRLIGKAKELEEGKPLHHLSRIPVLFVNEDPWVICLNPYTKQIYRIFHGAREFSAIFGGRLGLSGN